jgi:hypothetical protein
MENTCQEYNLTMLLIALVSICVHGFESVITFIVYTLKISTRCSMKETLKIRILRTTKWPTEEGQTLIYKA